MTPAARTPKRTKTAPNSAKPAADQAKQGVETGAAPAPKPASRPATGAKRGRAGAAETEGDRLRRGLARKGDSTGITMLIRQAARHADRLEAIDALLSGKADAWAVVSLPRTDTKRGRVVVEVQVGDLMREERARSVLLRHLLADIEKQRAGLPPDPSKTDDDDDLVD